MRTRLPVLGLTMLAAACSGPAQEEVPPPPTLHKSMTSTIEPGSELIQNAGIDLHNEEGELDATQLSDERWSRVAEAAAEIELVAVAFANAEEVTVASTGTTLLNEGQGNAASMADVRAYIDADPEGLKTEFRALAAAAQGVGLAAESRDAQALDEAIIDLTDTCTSCHNKFWYEQDAPEES